MSTTKTNPNIDDELSHAGVKGMRWGVRRYQNADGSLTDLGKKRYASAKRNAQMDAGKKAYNKAVEDHLKRNPDDVSGAKNAGVRAFRTAAQTTAVDRDEIFKNAVKEDLDATNTILREGGNFAGTAANAVRNVKVKVPRMDLSKMNDQELRDRITRENLESQYDRMFNPKRRHIERGRDAVADILDGVKLAGGAATTALTIALMVKQLRGK